MKGRPDHRIRWLWFAVAAAAGGGCSAADVVSGLGDVDNTDFIATESFLFSLDVSTQTALSIEGVNGLISVTADPTATAISVSGERRVGSSSTADARSHLANLRVVVEETGSTITVRTEQPQNPRGRSYVVDYTVRAPGQLRLAVGNVNGDIEIAGVENDVSVGGVNGNIDLVEILGAVSAGLVNGNIVADVILPPGSDVALGTVNGNLTLLVPTNASARVSASWVNGGFTSEGIDLEVREVTQGSVRGVLGNGLGEITMGTTNGQIRLLGR